MVTKKGNNTKEQGSELTGGKIMTGVLYIVTVLFVLGFLWHSIALFLLGE
jgi:hypothetical protein